MLFNSTGPIPQPLADAIGRAVLAVDIFAQVHIDSATRQILIEGQLTPQQATAALKQAGCRAHAAGEADADHEQGGSTCCGSCGSCS